MNEYLKLDNSNMKGHVYNSKATNARFKKVIMYVALLTVAIITWTQLDSLKQLHFNNEKHNNTQAITFSTAERDPSTWSIQVKENEPILSQRSIFPPILFAPNNRNEYPRTTAIINRIDDSDEGILHAVQHLMKYPFIEEIYVYNQIKTRPLKAEYLYPNSTKTAKKSDLHIEIIETDASLFSMGKFTACAVATFEKCYFQDDLWLNPYLDTLYTHSQRYPDHFIVNSRPVNYIDYKKWRFTNKDISLHTGYADLRYGAFVSRQKVQTFLSQLSTQGLETSKLRHAEIYFSIWLNQYPYMISNPLLSAGRDRFKNIDTVNNRELVEYYMYDAVSLLESSLNASKSILVEDNDYFDKSELMPIEQERDIRSSCSNDRCLFITNMDSMPNVDSLEFNSSIISNTSEYEALFNHTHPMIPYQTSYIHQSYHKAVDQNTETCWNSIKVPKSGDYFGLYMTGDISAKRVMLYTPNILDKPLDEIFKVTVQYHIFGSWEDCEIKLTPNTQLNYRIGFDFECPNHQPFKSIRVTFIDDEDIQQEPFELCGFGLDNFVV